MPSNIPSPPASSLVHVRGTANAGVLQAAQQSGTRLSAGTHQVWPRPPYDTRRELLT